MIMFGVVRGRLQLAVFNCNVATIASATELGFNHNSFLVNVRLISSSLSLNAKKRSLTAENHDEKAKRHYSFTVSYLVDICGLCRDSAESAAKVVALKTQKNPDEILGILREYGFSETHISLLVRNHPRVLLARKKTLLPKLDFLRSVGVSSSDMGKMVCWDSKWLRRSLKNHIVPCYDIFRSILLDDDKVCRCMRRLSFFSLHKLPKNLVNNVSLLKEFGLSQHMVSFLLTVHPSIVCCNTDKLSKDLRKAIEYGFDPSKWSFVNALRVICLVSRKTWEHKMAIYKRWGLSEDALLLAFKKDPSFMILSEKKITTTLDFLVTKMGWESSEVARFPSILRYSLEKRIVPRCLVIKTLMLKGFVKRQPSLSTIVLYGDKKFLELYVMKYKEEAHELLRIFQGKSNVVGSDKKSARKNL